MTNIMFLGCDLYHILSWFFVYSILGWAFESTFVSIEASQLVNRGFVTGPVCPIYGTGGTLIYLILHLFPDNMFVYYFLGMIVATVLEYFTSLIMEKLFQTRWWDYSEKPFNLNGRICLGASVAWGFFAVLVMEIIHPFVAMIVDSYSTEYGTIALIIILIIFAVDFTISVINAVQLSGKLARLTAIYNSATEYIGSTRIGAEAHNIKGKIDAVVNDSIKETINSNIGTVHDALSSKIGPFLELYNKVGTSVEERESFAVKIKEAASKYASMLTQVNFFQKRVLKAYPHMKSMAVGGQEQLNRMKTVLKIKFKDLVSKEEN